MDWENGNCYDEIGKRVGFVRIQDGAWFAVAVLGMIGWYRDQGSAQAAVEQGVKDQQPGRITETAPPKAESTGWFWPTMTLLSFLLGAVSALGICSGMLAKIAGR